jgi:hypothetical protein
LCLFTSLTRRSVNTADKGNVTTSSENLLAEPQLPAAKSHGMAPVHKLTWTDALKADQAFDSLDLASDYGNLST